MHPNPAFRAAEAELLERAAEAELLERAAAIGFAHLFVATPEGPMVAHAPVTRHGYELWFHLSRANRLHPHVSGARVLASVAGPEGYVSPNWYARPGNQVPTWNYVVIEIEGVVRPLPEAGLLEQLDALADRHEPRPNPWTRGKADPAVIAAMLRAIEGFAIAVEAVRGCDKLSQNKPAADRAGVIAGLYTLGNAALAGAMSGSPAHTSSPTLTVPGRATLA